MNAKWIAGETAMSEYVIIIALRWTIVIIFQFPLLWSCCSTVFSVFDFLIHGLRKVAMIIRKRGRSRNQDGTFAMEDETVGPKRRGRPPKHNSR